MKIDTSTIEGFDGMSAEDKVNALLGIDIPDNEKQITDLKNLLSKANAEAKKYKDEKNASLSESEKKAQEIAEELNLLREQNAALVKEKQIAAFTASYTAMGYDEKSAREAAEALSEGDTTKVFELQKTFQAEREKAIKAENVKNMTTPPNGGGTTYKSKKDIMAIKDTQERQKAIADNPQLFN